MNGGYNTFYTAPGTLGANTQKLLKELKGGGISADTFINSLVGGNKHKKKSNQKKSDKKKSDKKKSNKKKSNKNKSDK